MGVLISGKAQVDHEEMLRCCWPAYLTVMYDAEKVGLVRAKATKMNNDYALWLNISVKPGHGLSFYAAAQINTVRQVGTDLSNTWGWKRQRVNSVILCLLL